jgi:hypothetical protein
MILLHGVSLNVQFSPASLSLSLRIELFVKHISKGEAAETGFSGCLRGKGTCKAKIIGEKYNFGGGKGY